MKKNKLADFIDGFASETGVSRDEASAQWAGFSIQLSDSERREVEARGYNAGREEGIAFNVFHGAALREVGEQRDDLRKAAEALAEACKQALDDAEKLMLNASWASPAMLRAALAQWEATK